MKLYIAGGGNEYGRVCFLVEGETTSFYIYRQLSQYNVKVTSLARGLGFGDDLEYADELTLGCSIVGRQPFKP